MCRIEKKLRPPSAWKRSRLVGGMGDTGVADVSEASLRYVVPYQGRVKHSGDWKFGQD